MVHVAGQSRYQTTLFPETLDDVVNADHPVRVIDAFVDSLDLAQLGFTKVVAEATGRPPDDPGDLLKLYIYGDLNQVRSSRRLAREAQRNVEVLWPINRLAPSFKTIADFRRDHPRAIVGVCRGFIRFCRGQSLYGGELLAIDGTKIEAAASRKQVITPKSLARKTATIDRKIAEYLAAMDEADRQEPASEAMPAADVSAALAALRTQRDEVRRQAGRLAGEGLTQRVVGEPEARLMRTARHGHQVAYNAQSVVDAEHKPIVAFDLTNQGNDHRLLHPMAVQGRDAVEAEQVSVVADTLEAMHRRAMGDPVWMQQRRCLVEHPFGTMKWLMGHPRFLVRGLKKAKAELALTILGYNLKRVINILGVPALLAALEPAPG